MSEQKLNRVQVDELSKEDLAKYANDTFGVSLDASKKKREMLDALEKAVGKDLYAPDSDDEKGAQNGGIGSDSDESAGTDQKADPKEQGAAQTQKQRLDAWDPRKHPRHTVTIHADDKPGGGQPVPISVNGHALLIHRGVKVSIPEPHVEALRNALTTVYEQETIRGDIVKTSRQVPSYNFTDHGPTPPGADIPGAPPASPYNGGTPVRKR